jgi:malate synthase
MTATPPRAEVTTGAFDSTVLTADALALVATLQRTYGHARSVLLRRRRERAEAFRAGVRPGLDPATADIRDGEWRVPPAPPDLADRRCEITGPADRTMMVSALNSGARVFLCDLEDALAPTWSNILEGHRRIRDYALGTLSFTREDGRIDAVAESAATIVVRPRGLHLDEDRVQVDGGPVAAGLFDVAVAATLAGPALVARGSGLYLYLPKLESRHEAQWWDALLGDVERRVGLPPRSIRVTVLIETITAAFEMEEPPAGWRP